MSIKTTTRRTLACAAAVATAATLTLASAGGASAATYTSVRLGTDACVYPVPGGSVYGGLYCLSGVRAPNGALYASTLIVYDWNASGYDHRGAARRVVYLGDPTYLYWADLGGEWARVARNAPSSAPAYLTTLGAGQPVQWLTVNQLRQVVAYLQANAAARQRAAAVTTPSGSGLAATTGTSAYSAATTSIAAANAAIGVNLQTQTLASISSSIVGLNGGISLASAAANSPTPGVNIPSL